MMSYQNSFTININFKHPKNNSDVANKCLSELIYHHPDTICISLTSHKFEQDSDIIKMAR